MQERESCILQVIKGHHQDTLWFWRVETDISYSCGARHSHQRTERRCHEPLRVIFITGYISPTWTSAKFLNPDLSLTCFNLTEHIVRDTITAALCIFLLLLFCFPKHCHRCVGIKRHIQVSYFREEAFGTPVNCLTLSEKKKKKSSHYDFDIHVCSPRSERKCSTQICNSFS